jgi:hypothetical protein
LVHLRLGQRAGHHCLHVDGHRDHRLVKNGKSAPAIISPIAIVLQFISGVYFVFAELPTWMQEIASLVSAEMDDPGHAIWRSVFLPDSYSSQEPTGSWEHGRIALVLLIWCVAGAPRLDTYLPLAKPGRRLTDRRARLKRLVLRRGVGRKPDRRLSFADAGVG